MPRKRINFINTEEEIKIFSTLFPENSKVLLTGGGKQFVERIGIETIRKTICSVMVGNNIRSQTEFISRRRIAQISGAVIAMLTKGYAMIPNFLEKSSSLSIDYLSYARRSNNAETWPSRWLLGLTGKADQNVFRGDSGEFLNYLNEFEKAIIESAKHCLDELGEYEFEIIYPSNDKQNVKLNWEGMIKLTTAIGAQTLTIRGSDKSMYGKLFERLILGSFLTMIGFKRVNRQRNEETEKVFWLSDSKENRESDATVLVSAGKVVRFDIGFIGKGNSEISKDKLSRFDKEIEIAGNKSNSVTFIVVDRLPRTSKTEAAAKKIGAEIVQMSMQYWPKELCIKLKERCDFEHELQNIADEDLEKYITEKLRTIPLQDFLSDVTIDELTEPELELDDSVVAEDDAPFE